MSEDSAKHKHNLILSKKLDLADYTSSLIRRGLVLAKQLADDSPEKQIDAFLCFMNGMVSEREGKWFDAMKSYVNFMAIYPKWAAGWYKNGDLCRKFGDIYGRHFYRPAIKMYTRVISIEPDNFFAYYFRGISWYSQKYYDQAISDFDKALTIIPVTRNGVAYRWILKFNHARPCFLLSSLTLKEEKVLRLCFGIGDVDVHDDDFEYVTTDHGNIGGKEFFFDGKGYNFKSYIANLHYYLGRAHEGKKQFEKAINHMNSAIASYADCHCNAYISRGRIYLTIGQYVKAISDFQKVIERCPDIAETSNKYLRVAKRKMSMKMRHLH